MRKRGKSCKKSYFAPKLTRAGVWIPAIFVRSAILLRRTSNSAGPYVPGLGGSLSLSFAARFIPTPFVYRDTLGMGGFFPRSRGALRALRFWGAWAFGLAARVIDMFGSWGRVVGMCRGLSVGGLRGVLGGVGGFDGGLCSIRGGPRERFSKILPETKGKHPLHHLNFT